LPACSVALCETVTFCGNSVLAVAEFNKKTSASKTCCSPWSQW